MTRMGEITAPTPPAVMTKVVEYRGFPSVFHYFGNTEDCVPELFVQVAGAAGT